MLSYHVKFVQTDGRTDRQTDGPYAPDLSMRWHKKSVDDFHMTLPQKERFGYLHLFIVATGCPSGRPPPPPEYG